MLRNPEGRAAIRKFANEYKDAVVENVPIRTGELQDEYEASGRVRSGHLLYGTPTMQYWTGVHIYHIIEWGSIKNPPYAPLRRTADSLGLAWEGK
jgi:hypothetical protein